MSPAFCKQWTTLAAYLVKLTAKSDPSNYKLNISNKRIVPMPFHESHPA